MVDNKELIDLTCNLSTTIIGYDRHDIIDHVSNKLKESLLCPTEIEMDTEEVQLLSDNIYKDTGAYSIYSLSGSDAIESAIRCATIYHEGRRKNIVAFHNSFHGSNLLNLNLSNVDPATAARNKPSDDGFIHLKNTNHYHSIQDFEKYTIEQLKVLFETQNVSCIVQESSCWLADFITPSDNYWTELKKLCEQYDVLLIVDDIAICGGKIGQLYGFDVVPDIFCVGKAFSGGYFPLSACCVNQKVYDRIKDKLLTHSYTHSFHLPGIVAANYYHKILKEENILENVPNIISNARKICFDLPIKVFRNHGTMFSIKLSKSMLTQKVDEVFQSVGLNKGFIVDEPATEKIIWCVPLVADEQYFNEVEKRLKRALELLY
jgi:adenosylmethionine-8-amino-7-oxononanoate aminotransferase